MSEKRTIQINPDLFKVSNKSTRKKQAKINAPKIEMKTNLKKQKQKSLRKNVLKMIREKQQDEYKRLFDKSKDKLASKNIESAPAKEFNKEFDDSLEFFSSLANKPENQINENNNNKTFKKYPNDMIVPTMPTFIDTNENVNLQFPDIGPTMTPRSMSPSIHLSQPHIPQSHISQPHIPQSHIPQPQQRMMLPLPKYGCLKNGSLPTYRAFHNTTQRAYPSQYNIQPSNNIQSVNGQSVNGHSVNGHSVNDQNINNLSVREPIMPFQNQKLKTSEILQKYDKQSTKQRQNKIKYLKQRKIFKRTYHVGRCKTKPLIGVLVSNRTIRNRISTQSQLLKQTPIQDVRKFLIKKGFIKVGTNSPNDVLRKMYESVSLVCGEIENHNPENLLFNFIHDTVQ